MIQLLDCTIRDGGYINDWDFSEDFAKSLYRAVSDSGCAYAEIGFFNPRPKSPAPWCNCSPELISRLKAARPNGAGIAVMIDFGACAAHDVPESSVYPADMIRVAVAKKDREAGCAFAAALRRKGYKTTVNFMAVTDYSNEEILDLIRLINGYKESIDYFYIADSFGGLMPARAKEIFTTLRFGTEAKLGFHPHNNLQLAFANSLEAITAGFAIIDGSILGIGRGAGNLYLEAALAYMEQAYPKSYRLLPVLRFAEMFVEPMKDEYAWGYSLTQLLSGILSCHPNYPTNLLRLKNYTADDVYHMLQRLSPTARARYEAASLDAVVHQHEREKPATVISESVRARITKIISSNKGKVLLLCGGGSMSSHAEQLREYLKREAMAVIAVNHPPQGWQLDAVFYGNGRRLWQYIDETDGVPVIYAHGLALPEPRELAMEVDFKPAFGLERDVVITNSGVMAALSLAALGASRIDIAGMDGFTADGSRDFYYNERDRAIDVDACEQLNRTARKELTIATSLLKARGIGIGIITPTVYTEHQVTAPVIAPLQ